MISADGLVKRSEPWMFLALHKYLNAGTMQDEALMKANLLNDVKIRSLLADISHFHDFVVNSHKNVNNPMHKLLFLLDLGLDRSVTEIDEAIQAILAHQDRNGVYQTLMNISVNYGGTGENVFTWALCDAPLLLLALVKAGVDYPSKIKPGVDHLVSTLRPNGFPCIGSQELGTFRGPGKKEDPCPYASLIMLKLLAEIPEYHDSETIKTCANTLLDLWSNSLTQHPYMFYMGNDFRKAKGPTSWYDLLSVCDVLSQVKSVHTDPRFIEMIELLKSKVDDDGMLVPESVYVRYKDWDFGQKKESSAYLTFILLRILNRLK
ncbi:MAG: hypothetical protein A2Y20_09115 [Firmicutes bacterium GWF2_51_9]|nr:MAG: hypothetical protein A2Y20_09115 [Firmicutes bacterium GWF2_51_9]OGS58081.1 MAG: hypothetical protein A2Y19_05960 [Firmicutes bacterium GWE2_51_13]HBZ41277.1 hypothetical protein [Erysipelotrichaceae bacterium]